MIALLVAFSLVALAAAGVMLAAGAQAEVQRRLHGIGVQRALGFTPRADRGAAGARRRAARAARGRRWASRLGALAAYGPVGAAARGAQRAAAGLALARPCSRWRWSPWWRWWPRPRPGRRGARRGGRRSQILRGRGAPAGRARIALPGRLRSASACGWSRRAARARWPRRGGARRCAAGVVLLMLALASLLQRLRERPGHGGQALPAHRAASPPSGPARSPRCRASRRRRRATRPTPRTPSSSARPLRLDRLPRRPHAASRPAAGAGPARALARRGRGGRPAWRTRSGCGRARRWRLELPDGGEVRFRVVGVVRALENDGRDGLRAGRTGCSTPTRDSAPRSRSGCGRDASQAALDRRLRQLGALARARSARRDERNETLLGVLAALLRGVGLAIGLVCLYTLVQALAMTARERRSAVAVLRAAGAGARRSRRVLAGAALAVAWPAPRRRAIALEVSCSARRSRGWPASYASLPLHAGTGQIAHRRGRAARARAAAAAGVGAPARARAGGGGAAGGLMRRARTPRSRSSPPPAARAAAPARRAAARRAAARRCAPPGRPRGDGTLERGPGEPFVSGPTWQRRRAPGRAARDSSPSSPTRTCATRSRPRACRSSTARRALQLDVPPAGGALAAGARGRGALDRRAAPSGGGGDRRHRRHGQQDELDAGAGRCSTAARSIPTRGAPRLRRRAGGLEPGPALLPPRRRRAARSRAARRGAERRFRSPGPRRAVVPGARQPRRAGSGRGRRHAARSTPSRRARGWSRAARPGLRPGRRRRARGRTADAAGRAALPGRTAPVAAPTRTRRHCSAPEVVSRLTAASARARQRPAARYYASTSGRRVRGIVLDTVDRRGGSRRRADAPRRSRGSREQLARRRRPLGDRRSATSRSTSLSGGAAALALLDRDPHVVGGGRRQHATATGSRPQRPARRLLADRAPRRSPTTRSRRARSAWSARASGGVVLETWMIDHDGRRPRRHLARARLPRRAGRPPPRLRGPAAPTATRCCSASGGLPDWNKDGARFAVAVLSYGSLGPAGQDDGPARRCDSDGGVSPTHRGRARSARRSRASRRSWSRSGLAEDLR